MQLHNEERAEETLLREVSVSVGTSCSVTLLRDLPLAVRLRNSHKLNCLLMVP